MAGRKPAIVSTPFAVLPSPTPFRSQDTAFPLPVPPAVSVSVLPAQTPSAAVAFAAKVGGASVVATAVALHGELIPPPSALMRNSWATSGRTEAA